MILDVQHAHQGIRDDADLAPTIHQLGALVHEVQAVNEGRAGYGRHGDFIVGAEQVDAVHAQRRQIRPALADGVQPLAEGAFQERQEA